MYIAPPSREERSEILVQTIRDIQFGALVVASADGLTASHIPMLVREKEGGQIVIEGHVARPNDLWKTARAGCKALAIFQGPQAYIHPGWYPTKKEDGKAVPTWNYIAVHVHGTLQAIEDGGWLRRHLTDLTSINEDQRSEPWAISDAPADFLAAMLKGIVGLRFEVERMEGNWKMAQRQPLQNRLGAIAGLAASDKPSDREVALAMTEFARS